MLPHLSFDIQVEVIKRLPVTSLVQFRSVCKAWKSLIDSSKFIAGYKVGHDHLLIRYEIGYEKEDEAKYVCFVDDDDDDSFLQKKFALAVPPLLQAKATTIIGSSHGLLCFTGYFRERDDSRITQMALLWNPTIRKSIVVGVPNVVNRVFDYVVGFGVCPDTKDPKLVKITYIYDYKKMESISSIPCQVMIFTLSSREWTASSCTNLPRKSIEFTRFHTVVGQFIYWLASDRTAMNGGYRYHNLIMSFNMITEELREVDLPHSLSNQCNLALMVSRIRESLAVIECNKGVCGVWMMEHGDSKAFTKLFTINASVLRTLGFRKSGEPILVMEDDNEEFLTPCALVVYEPCSENIKDLGIRGNGFSFSASSYTESLLLLDHDDGHIIRCGATKT